MAGKSSNPINGKVLWDLLSKSMSVQDIGKAVDREKITKAVIKNTLVDYCLNENMTTKNLKTRIGRIGIPKAKDSKKKKIKKLYAKVTAGGSISIPASIIKVKEINPDDLFKKYEVRHTSKTGKITLTPVKDESASTPVEEDSK